MNTRHQHIVIFFFSLIVLFSIGCRKEEINPSEPTVTQHAVTLLDVAKKDSRLSLFVQAAQRVKITRLERNESVTLVAPTNEAFTAYMRDNGFATVEDIPTATLQNLILNHMIPSNFSPSSFPAGYLPTLAEVKTAKGTEAIQVFVERRDRSILLNGVEVSQDATWTENGILYTTSKVIEIADAKAHILNNPKFTSFAAALQRTDLDKDYLALFKSVQTSTVLVPTNGAFASFLIEQRVSSLDKIPAATLSAILAYHLSPNASLRLTDLTGIQTLTTLQGKTLRVEATGNSVALVDIRGRKCFIEESDIRASNAILHSTTRLLMPQ